MSLDAIKTNLRNKIVEELGADYHDNASKVDPGRVKSLLERFISIENTPLSADDRRQLSQDVMDDVLGYGPVSRYLADPEVTEVMINGADSVYVERKGRIEATEARFIDELQVKRLIDKILRHIGRRIDESSPMADARLPDGSRVNIIIPPLSIDGPAITIRKFSADPFTVQDLIDFGTMTPTVADFLQQAVAGKLNIIVSGGTGSGKTTTLNVLSSFIPEHERILTIEDTAELQLHQAHLLRLESRPPNIEGTGEVTIRDLVRNALRMRPDRIVVGEARGGEALDMLQAMYTGHDGSLSTIHANSPRDALARLETMMLMAGTELPDRAIREQVCSAVDMVLHVARLSDGSRKITNIAEVQGMEGDIVTMQDIFLFDFASGFDEEGHYKGHLKATGVRPQFLDKMSKYGVSLPAELFQMEQPQKGRKW